jgi:Ca2+-dependent lipid-binding protein
VIGKSDPYFVLSKQTDSGEYVKIYKSEVVSNNLNPVWKRLVIT